MDRKAYIRKYGEFRMEEKERKKRLRKAGGLKGDNKNVIIIRQDAIAQAKKEED